MLATDLPDVDHLAAICELSGASLLKMAGALRERKRATASDDYFSIELEWEGIEGIAHGLLKAPAVWDAKIR